MRTIGLVVIVLLAFGMAWGPTPAIAKDETAIDQCQTLTDTELEQVRGKLLGSIYFKIISALHRVDLVLERSCQLYFQTRQKVKNRTGIEIPPPRYCGVR